MKEKIIFDYLETQPKGAVTHIVHLRLGLISKGQTRSCQLDINHISLSQTHFWLFWKSDSLQITKRSK